MNFVIGVVIGALVVIGVVWAVLRYITRGMG